MRIRIFEALDLDFKIQNIKHLRNATGLSLKESKDIVDELFKSPSKIGIEVHIKDNFTDDDWDAFAEWFEYESVEALPKGTLKLFRVIFTGNKNTYTSVVLATKKSLAIEAVEEELDEFFPSRSTPMSSMTIACEKVTSFKNGQVLLMSRL